MAAERTRSEPAAHVDASARKSSTTKGVTKGAATAAMKGSSFGKVLYPDPIFSELKLEKLNFSPGLEGGSPQETSLAQAGGEIWALDDPDAIRRIQENILIWRQIVI